MTAQERRAVRSERIVRRFEIPTLVAAGEPQGALQRRPRTPSHGDMRQWVRLILEAEPCPAFARHEPLLDAALVVLLSRGPKQRACNRSQKDQRKDLVRHG